MNKFYKKYRIAGNWINIMLLLCVLVPLIALSRYNHPLPADDYCYIDTVFKYGWLEAMNFYYTGWTGRYFGILLNHSNPLLFHSFTGFKVLPAVLLIAFVYALYILLRQLTPTLSRMAHFGFSGVIFFLFILQMPSLAEAFYWMASFVGYTTSNVLTMLWIVVVMKWYRSDTPGVKILFSVLSAVLIACIVGSSETSLLTLILLIAGWWGIRLLFQRKTDALMITSLIIAIISCYFFFTAPGNAVRLAGNPMSGNIFVSALLSFKKLALLAVGWITRTPLLLFSLAWLVVLSRLSEGARNYFNIPVWYALLLFVGVLSAELFPSYYGVGAEVDPTPRVINCVYFFFLIGWFYVIGVIFHTLVGRNVPAFTLPALANGVFYFILSLAIVYAFVKSNNVKMIYTDLLKGKAAAYDKEVYARYNLLMNSKERVVYLPPLRNLPESIFVLNEDIKADHNYLWNRCMAGYFGKEAIYMIDKKSGQ